MEPEIAAVIEAITCNEDLLSEILVRLPPKPLIRFKSVSKTWLRLISGKHLRRRHSQRLCKETSGLLRIPMYLDSEPDRKCQFIPIDENGRNSPLESLDFVPGEEKLEVTSHCNGLLLCRSRSGENQYNYYVFNPTTKEYATVSVEYELGGTDFKHCAVNLAFDPRKSLHYKLLFIYESGHDFRLQIYSSETGVTRQIDTRFSARVTVPSFRGGVYKNGGVVNWNTIYSHPVYWNGAVNWTACLHEGLYFNVDEERFGTHPVLPLPEEALEGSFERIVVYFGESNDHLHLIETYRTRTHPHTPPLEFDVYEMERDYSRWFVRFRVNIEPLITSFSFRLCELIFLPRRKSALVYRRNNVPPLLDITAPYTEFGVMGVVRKDDDEKSFLVVSYSGMVWRFNFEDGSFAKIGVTGEHELYDYMDSFEFTESIYPP